MREKPKIGKIWALLLSIAIVVVAVQLIASNALAGRGGELGELESKAARLGRENQLLKSDVSEKASLSRIAKESADLGLTKPDSVIYPDLSQPVAVLPQ